ncbi:hypothetical protein AKO1_012471 [Acrasis kona]|uniref:CRAL-TRIO domain-containing protein n=1 Tax=Acrasis kona TaxID=1008807 RepID=A0AAW2YXX6_9EUKA
MFKSVDLKSIQEKKIFYLGQSLSVDQRPVLYFVPRHLQNTDISLEHLFYHILKTLQTVFTKPYEMVLDCTDEGFDFDSKNLISFYKIIPHGGRKNLAKLIIYNPNSHFREQCKKLPRIVSRKLFKKIRFVTNLKEFTTCINQDHIELPESSMLDFDSHVHTTISPAWVVGDKGSQSDAILKLTADKLAVIQKKVNVIGLETRVVDFIDINAIVDAKIEQNHHASFKQVKIEYEISKEHLLLRTENNEQLVMAIHSSIVRFHNERKVNQKDSHSPSTKTINQDDIPGMMLNLSFLNLESKFPKTRSEAYNLLAALAQQFDFPVTLLEAQDLAVPHNTANLVVKLSEQVALAKPFLTPQFLRECLNGFDKVSLPYKFLCLKYMKPWIKNLSTSYARAKQDDETQRIVMIREWFPSLVQSTVSQPDIYPALLSEIWAEIAEDDSLVMLSVECILATAVQEGVTSVHLDILNDLMVTLGSSQRSHIVMDEILAQMMECMDTQIESESHSASWDKMIIYCRFLMMLSFQDCVCVRSNLPILLHMITLLVGRGTLFFRVTVHSLAINVIHSLATALSLDSRVMQEHFSRLGQLRNMFLGKDVLNVLLDPFDSKTIHSHRKELEPARMGDMETLVSFFVDVLKSVFQVQPDLQRMWLQEWTDMCRDQIMRNHPVWLSRALTAYGVLVRPGQDTSDTLPFVLDALVGSLRAYGQYQSSSNSSSSSTTMLLSGGGNNSANTPPSKSSPSSCSSAVVDMPVSALLCLGQYCSKMNPDDPVLNKILLTSCMLLATCDAVLFSAVVHLFDCVLTAISQSRSFRECGGLEEYFLQKCNSSPSQIQIINQFEKSIGINFNTHFSFAMSVLFMKGLTMSETKERAAQMCTKLIDVINKVNPNVNEILGYITALIPYHYDSLSTLLGDHFVLFTEDTFGHPHSALLFTRYLLTVVENVEFEPGMYREHIYGVLSEAFKKIPNVFECVYPDVMPRVIDVYKTATSSRIVEVSLSLINTMMMCGGKNDSTTGGNSFVHQDLLMNNNSPGGGASMMSGGGNGGQHLKDDLNLKNIQFGGMVRAGSFKQSGDKGSMEVLNLTLDYIKNEIASGLDRSALLKYSSGSKYKKHTIAKKQSMETDLSPPVQAASFGTLSADERTDKSSREPDSVSEVDVMTE